MSDDKEFVRNGFIPYEDSNKYIKVIYNGEESKIDFMTNIVHEVTNDLNIAIGMTNENDSEYKLFINKDYNPLCGEEYTYPLRTFYSGLMPEPFKLVYPLIEGKETKIITDKGEKLIISIELR
jgi:hypothetical protein